jgi:hypothetical protein
MTERVYCSFHRRYHAKQPPSLVEVLHSRPVVEPLGQIADCVLIFSACYLETVSFWRIPGLETLLICHPEVGLELAS